MHRLACVDLPALPLQLLLREHPDWCRSPVAVVDRDRPQGKILWVNEPARRVQIFPGMRYSAALSLSGALRAAEVPPTSVATAIEAALRTLQQHSPEVEVNREEPGVFWLNAIGIERLYGSLQDWARALRNDLEANDRCESTVVVGFSKLGTYAARSLEARVLIFATPSEEDIAVRSVPIERLDLGARALAAFSKLGIATVGQLTDLPPEGIERRFGKRARELHALARGDRKPPLVSAPLETPLRERAFLDNGECDAARLLAQIEALLQPLLEQLAHRGLTLIELALELGFENGRRHSESLRPAAPTLEVRQLHELVALRLASLRLEDRVSEVALEAKGQPATMQQLDLFTPPPPRPIDAAERALARIRAEWGESAVVRADLRAGHLPEARFSWEPMTRLRPAEPILIAPREGDARWCLVRRLYQPPFELPARPRQEPDGWILRGLEEGPVVRLLGPYVIAGGWWRRAAHRDYHFAETQRGDILWVYYDRVRRRWFIQGRVE